MYHQFNTELACEVGVEKAIILENIYFWIMKNEANSKNEHDGNYWTYNSYEAFAKLFPYMKLNTIKRHMRELEKQEILLSRSDLNKNPYDKTKWYALNLENSIIQIYFNITFEAKKGGQKHKPSIVKKITIEEKENNIREKEKSRSLYTDNNTDNNTDNIKEKKEKKKKPEELEYPPNLNIEAFNDWLDYKGKSYSHRGKVLSMNKLSKYGHSTQQEMVNNSIINGWSGLFEIKVNNPKSKISQNRENIERFSQEFFGNDSNNNLNTNMNNGGYIDYEQK
jgi:hypothetical protein